MRCCDSKKVSNSSGKTSLETAQYQSSIGMKVVAILSVVDRLEGGTESLSKHGFNSISLMTSADLKQA